MTERVPNPKTEEEAMAELINTAEKFCPHMVTEQLKRDENGNLSYQKVYIGGYPHSTPKNPYMQIVSANQDFGETTIGSEAKEAQLSLQDYQSVCVEKNVNYSTKKLIWLCAQGKTEEADKILPGFSEKYQSAVSVSNGGATYSVDGDVYQQMKADVRQNFAKIHPNFLETTQAQWEKDRQDLMIPDNENEPVSDAAYYFLAKDKYILPSEENDILFAQTRQQNDEVVQQFQAQKERDNALKQKMQRDSNNARQLSQQRSHQTTSKTRVTTKQTPSHNQSSAPKSEPAIQTPEPFPNTQNIHQNDATRVYRPLITQRITQVR